MPVPAHAPGPRTAVHRGDIVQTVASPSLLLALRAAVAITSEPDGPVACAGIEKDLAVGVHKHRVEVAAAAEEPAAPVARAAGDAGVDAIPGGVGRVRDHRKT